jgi:hypothetical protein
MQKNVSGQKVGAQMISATDGSAFTGSVTVSVTVDAGTQATGSVGSGAATHEGNGYHTYAPSQSETNGDLIAFTFTGTGAVPQTVQVYTRAPTPDVNVVQISGDSTAADNLEAAADGTGYNLGGGSVVAASVTGAVGSVTGNVTGSVGSLAAQAKADVNAEVDQAISDAALATASGLSTVEGKIDTLDTNVDTLLTRLSGTRAGYLDSLNAPALPSGAVVSGGGNSATSFVTDRTETTDDYWKDALLLLTSGVLTGQVKKVTAYNGTTKAVTVENGFTGTPAAGVTFLLVNS